MRLITFRHDGTDFVGSLSESRIVSLTRAYAAYLHSRGVPLPYSLAEGELPNGMLQFLSAGDRALEAARRAVEFARTILPGGQRPIGPRGERLLYQLAEVELLAPLPRPGKLLCIGLNYRDHAAEVGMKLPDRPLLFAKFGNSVVGPGAPVILPSITQQVDYEVELAVVIGKAAKGVPVEKAMEYVAGYTVLNDVSARDLQFPDGQWVRGKTLDSFCPLGPALVTRDEAPDPHSLGISLHLNGEVMQHSNTRNMVFGVPELVSFLCQAITLEPGDIIATGTPPGVGHNRRPPVYLKDGDVMVAEVEGVGVLENPVVQDGC